MASKKPRFFRFLKNLKIFKSPDFRFLGFIIFVQFCHKLYLYFHILVEICGFCYNFVENKVTGRMVDRI